MSKFTAVTYSTNKPKDCRIWFWDKWVYPGITVEKVNESDIWIAECSTERMETPFHVRMP